MERITRICSACGGTGRETGERPPEGGGPPVPYDNPCGRCNGVGWFPFGDLSSDLTDFLNDMNDKIGDIQEVVGEIKTKVDTL